MTDRWVWVLRHAKAAQGPVDHERALTDRGRRQSAELHDRISGLGGGSPAPSAILCSSARRARQTAQGVVGGFDPEPPVLVERELYQADADDVVDRLRSLPDEDAAVMVVGHNPTLLDLVLLLDTSDDEARPRLDAGFPTTALAVLRLPASRWSAIGVGTGTLVDLWRPSR